MRALVVTALALFLAYPAIHASAAEQGDVIYSNNLGVPLYTHNFDTGKDVTIGDRQYLSEFMGAHYFVTSRVRVGMMFQFTEQLGGALAPGADHLTITSG